MPYPPCQSIIQKFKVILIPRAVIESIDRMPANDQKYNVPLIDATAEHAEKVNLGLNINNVKKAWNEVKKTKITAGEAVRQPFKREEIKFRPFDMLLDSQVERFLDEFVLDKQIALHLGNY